MTVEEKAKAYDEALERAKAYHRNELAGSRREMTEYIFPELRESEDERIRKEIIDFIQWAEDRGRTRYDHHQAKRPAVWIAYLEKQKEHSVSAEEVLAKAGLKPYKDGNKWCILAGDNIQEGICGFGDTIDEALYQFLMEVLEKQKKSLHVQETCKENTDSFISEDERIRKEIIDFLETIPASELKRIPRPISEWFTYLEKKKEQKPAEWSKEDKDNLDNIIWLCENCEKGIENVWIPSQATQIKNLIKSLRPQPSWKPSKEQMMALEDVITMKRAVNEAATEVLRELYVQLKRL